MNDQRKSEKVVPGMIVSLIMIRKKSILGEFILTGLFGIMTLLSYYSIITMKKLKTCVI